MAKQTQIETYEKLAKKPSNLNSKSVFLKDLRKKLLSHAAGKTLEVGVGPGTNFQFYPPDVAITAVDFSPSLLNMARSAAWCRMSWFCTQRRNGGFVDFEWFLLHVGISGSQATA